MSKATNGSVTHAWIDDGSRNVKVFIEGMDKIHVIETLVREGSDEVNSYNTNNLSYTVQNKRSTSTLLTNTSNYQRSDVNRVAINHALLSIGVKGDVVVHCGLPLDQYFQPGGMKVDYNRLNEKRESIMMPVVFDTDNSPMPFKIVSVEVHPEAIPALYAAINEGYPIYGDTVTVADAGGWTLDVASLVIDDDEIQVDSNLTELRGYFHCLDVIATMLENNNPKLSKSFKNAGFRYRKAESTFSKDSDEHELSVQGVKKWFDDIVVSANIEEQIITSDNLLLVGGSIHYLGDLFVNHPDFEHISIISMLEPETAILRGMLAMNGIDYPIPTKPDQEQS